MLNGYLTSTVSIVIILQFLSLANIIFILNLVNEKNIISLYLTKKINQRLVILLLWIIMLLPISSLFLLKINLLTNISNSLVFILIILIIINTITLVSYWTIITNKIDLNKNKINQKTYDDLINILFFVTANTIYFLWVLILL